MRFSTRLAMSLVVLLTIGAVLTARLSLEARAEARSDNVLSETLEPALRSTERLGRRYVSLQNNVRGYLLTGDRAFLDAVAQIDEEINGIKSEIATDLGPTIDRTPQLLDRLTATESAWREQAVDVELQMLAVGATDELTAFISEGTPNELFSEVLAAWSDLRTAVEKSLTEVRVKRTDSLRALSILGVALVAVGVAAALFTSVWLRRTVLRPLATLVRASERLLSGDRETPVGSVDVAEFRPLAEALDSMRRQVDGMISDRTRAEVLVALDEQLAVVANDLHDDPVQAMTAALMRVHRLGRIVGAEHSELVDSAEESIGNAVQRLRRFTFAVHPTGLTDDGLATTVRSFARLELEGLDDPQIEVVGDAPVGLSPEVALVAFRVTREAVVNAIRHADPTTIRVEFIHGGGELTVVVEDDGQGFDTSAGPPGHRGLVAMQHLARTTGGSLEITSTPGMGSRVRVVLPDRAPVDGPPLATRHEGAVPGDPGTAPSTAAHQRPRRSHTP